MKIVYSGLKMPSLRYLDLGENQMNLRGRLMSNIWRGSHFILRWKPHATISTRVIKRQYYPFVGSTLQLTSLPAYLSQFKLLKYLDVRGNNITGVSENLRKLIEKNKSEAYFHGNPLVEAIHPWIVIQCAQIFVGQNMRLETECAIWNVFKNPVNMIMESAENEMHLWNKNLNPFRSQ